MAPRMLWAAALTRRAQQGACERSLAPVLLTQKRGISRSYLEKVAKAEKEWNEREQEINEGKREHVWDVLNARGLVKDTAPRPEVIRKVISNKRIAAYVGVDPTAESLHLGHLLPLMPLFWLYFHGMSTTSLIGGSTARIGDPTGRLESRKPLANSDIAANITKIHYQLKKIWAHVEVIGKKFGYEGEWAGRPHLRNNSMWLNSLPIYDFLKRLGRDMRIGPMLAKETVKRKMTEGDGMSFAEFTYPLLQGWDWWQMYHKNGVQMQIGGSDQFGNIVSGIEVVKTIRESETAPWLKKPSDDWTIDPVGFTTPLLTDPSGAKYGKTAGNAVWLDHTMTFPFDFYGWFVKRSDEEVENLLKLMTFLPLPDVAKLMELHRQDPPKRLAQHILAFEVTSIVHGPEVALREQMQHQLVFNKGPITPPEGMITSATGTKPARAGPVDGLMDSENAATKTIQLPRSLIMGKSIARILVGAKLAATTSEATRLVQQGGSYVAAQPGPDKQRLQPGNLDWTPIKTWFPSDTEKFVIDEKLLILRRGKSNVRIIKMVSDEEWAESGQRYPGEPYTGRVRRILAALDEEAKKKEEQGGEEAEEGEAEYKPLKTVPNNPDLHFPIGPKKGKKGKQ